MALPLNIEAVDVLLSVQAHLWRLFWRLYAGGGYIFTAELEAGLAQGGVELRGPTWHFVGATGLQPVFGADFKTFDEQNWEITTSIKGGIEWGALGWDHGIRLRLLAVYLDGFTPFGQFFSTTELRNFGVELQLEF